MAATRKPIRLANWTARRPRPPMPWTATRSPGRAGEFLSPLYDVTPSHSRGAASAGAGHHSGLPAVPSSRAAIAKPTERGATSSPFPCQTGVRPIPTAPSHPSENRDEQISAAFTLAWRDGLSRFRTCLPRFGRIDQRAQDACSILRCVGPTRAGNPGCATSQRPGASPRASRGHKLAGQYVVPRLYPIDDVADRGGVERVE